MLSQKRDAARRALTRWKVREEFTLSTPELVGTVINMAPMPGHRLAEGETVTLVIAVAEPPSSEHRSVPNVTNVTAGAAMQRLRAAGFKPVMLSVASTSAQRGTVRSQLPFPGSLLQEGSEVRVRVGRGGEGTDSAPANPTPENPSANPVPGVPAPENPSVNPPPAVALEMVRPHSVSVRLDPVRIAAKRYIDSV